MVMAMAECLWGGSCLIGPKAVKYWSSDLAESQIYHYLIRLWSSRSPLCLDLPLLWTPFGSVEQAALVHFKIGWCRCYSWWFSSKEQQCAYTYDLFKSGLCLWRRGQAIRRMVDTTYICSAKEISRISWGSHRAFFLALIEFDICYRLQCQVLLSSCIFSWDVVLLGA